MRRKIREKIGEKIDLRGKSGGSQKGGIWEGRDMAREKDKTINSQIIINFLKLTLK